MKLIKIIKENFHEEEHECPHHEMMERHSEMHSENPIKDLIEALKIIEQMKSIEKSEKEAEEVAFLDQASLRIKRALMKLKKGM